MKLDELAKKTVSLELVDFLEQYPHPALVFLTTISKPQDPSALKDRTQMNLNAVPAAAPGEAKEPDARPTLRLQARPGMGEGDALKDSQVLFLKGRVNDAKKGIALGRGQDNDYALPVLSVSKKHVLVKEGPEGWSLVDQKATNGTFVDQKRVEAGSSTKLAEGSVIGFGPDLQAKFFTSKGLYAFLRRYRVGMAV